MKRIIKAPDGDIDTILAAADDFNNVISRSPFIK